MDSNSDGAWRRAARVALLLIAGLTASAAPRSPFSAPAPAAAAPGASMRAGQAPIDDPTDEGDPDDTGDEEPFPVFEDTPRETPADSTSVNTPPPATGARPDSAAFLPVLAESTEAETLRYVPPGERPAATATPPTRPGDEPAPIVKKPKGGPFGLPPILIIAGLAVVHVFAVRLVTD